MSMQTTVAGCRAVAPGRQRTDCGGAKCIRPLRSPQADLFQL